MSKLPLASSDEPRLSSDDPGASRLLPTGLSPFLTLSGPLPCTRPLHTRSPSAVPSPDSAFCALSVRLYAAWLRLVAAPPALPLSLLAAAASPRAAARTDLKLCDPPPASPPPGYRTV